MNLSRLALVTIAIALFTVGCSKSDHVTRVTPPTMPAVSPQPSGTPNKFAVASGNFAKNCAKCHGPEGEGGTGEVEGKKIKGPPLSRGPALRHSDADFTKQITKGGDGMPAFVDKLSPEEIDALVAFIRRDLQAGDVKK